MFSQCSNVFGKDLFNLRISVCGCVCVGGQTLLADEVRKY